MAEKDNKSEIIAMRKSGKSLVAIATKFKMDKMDVRDICKGVDRTGRKAAKA